MNKPTQGELLEIWTNIIIARDLEDNNKSYAIFAKYIEELIRNILADKGVPK